MMILLWSQLERSVIRSHGDIYDAFWNIRIWRMKSCKENRNLQRWSHLLQMHLQVPVWPLLSAKGNLQRPLWLLHQGGSITWVWILIVDTICQTLICCYTLNFQNQETLHPKGEDWNLNIKYLDIYQRYQRRNKRWIS